MPSEVTPKTLDEKLDELKDIFEVTLDKYATCEKLFASTKIQHTFVLLFLVL